METISSNWFRLKIISARKFKHTHIQWFLVNLVIEAIRNGKSASSGHLELIWTSMLIFPSVRFSVLLGGWTISRIIQNFFQSFERASLTENFTFYLTSTPFPGYSASLVGLSQKKRKTTRQTRLNVSWYFKKYQLTFTCDPRLKLGLL